MRWSKASNNDRNKRTSAAFIAALHHKKVSSRGVNVSFFGGSPGAWSPRRRIATGISGESPLIFPEKNHCIILHEDSHRWIKTYPSGIYGQKLKKSILLGFLKKIWLVYKWKLPWKFRWFGVAIYFSKTSISRCLASWWSQGCLHDVLLPRGDCIGYGQVTSRRFHVGGDQHEWQKWQNHAEIGLDKDRERLKPQLWQFTSYKWLFQRDYTFYKWG